MFTSLLPWILFHKDWAKMSCTIRILSLEQSFTSSINFKKLSSYDTFSTSDAFKYISDNKDSIYLFNFLQTNFSILYIYGSTRLCKPFDSIKCLKNITNRLSFIKLLEKTPRLMMMEFSQMDIVSSFLSYM